MMVSIKKWLLSIFFLAAIPAFASKPVIVESHMTALKITELEKMPPPYAAYMWALANEAGYQSLNGSLFPALSYQAAFTKVLALIKPSQSRLALSWMDKMTLSQKEEQAVDLAFGMAERLFKKHYSELERGEEQDPDLFPNKEKKGIWRPTLPAFANPALPKWGGLPLISEASVDELTEDLKFPRLNSTQYKKELEEVYRLGGQDSKERTTDQTEIAKFWVGGSGTVTPPGLWVHIGLQRLQEVPVGFKDSVSVMRTLTFALCDAGIAAWKVKYEQKTWRPITAIHEELVDSNWKPLIPTPPFPAYVSGHSTFSAAAATVLAVILPLESEPLRVRSPDMPNTVRTFKTYKEAANEAGMSRIYGGIHFQADNVDGLLLGRKVGCALLDKMFEYKCD